MITGALTFEQAREALEVVRMPILSIRQQGELLALKNDGYGREYFINRCKDSNSLKKMQV